MEAEFARSVFGAGSESYLELDLSGTLEAMREAHPGLGVRGSLAVWGELAKENPHLQLSRRGAKLKRNTNMRPTPLRGGLAAVVSMLRS